MFAPHREANLLDHGYGSHASNREARKAAAVHAVIAELSGFTTSHVAEVSPIPRRVELPQMIVMPDVA